VIGNVGAIAQRSLKRMLAWSSVAQAGYLLAGVVVGTQLGVKATAFYLAVYLADERGRILRRDRARARVRVRRRPALVREPRRDGAPLLAWPMTIAMLSLAGFPATGGLHRQVLFDRRVRRRRLHLARHRHRDRSVISLAYYLRVIAVMWMGATRWRCRSVPPRRVRPVAVVPEADPLAQPEVVAVADICAVATHLLRPRAEPAVRNVARDVASAFPAD
jgi:NADH-quinone oxidoreductase subunit N